ncbi:MAG: 3-phosphoglycerate dehydrogenase family protein [Legionella sp.]|jgi:D-3-phosphoglycerate dehydrogenase
MFSIQLLDNISPQGLNLFNPSLYKLQHECSDPDAILVRSHKLHDYQFSGCLRAIGRAGAGTDNIPVDALTKLGIPVFYAPGANANAVKELVMAAMLIGYRNLDETRSFIAELTKENDQLFNKEIESQKKKFVGHEIAGKTLGVIGLGNIGVKVANAALGLGMQIIAYDPNLTVTNALELLPNVERVIDMNALLVRSDIITIHVPLNADTTNLINEKSVKFFKAHALLLNFSRGPIVSEQAILDQLQTNRMMGYITDFPTVKLANNPKVLCFPHLGASTLEAEQHSAEMVVGTLCNFFEYGIIEHSVNFPNVSLNPTQMAQTYRIMIINENQPGALSKITQTMSQLGYNIEQMENKSRGTIAVNLIDFSGQQQPDAGFANQFKSITGVLQAYLI